ncbi:hypothetical protein [Nostoc sp.]
MNARECQKPQITNDLPHLWLVDSQGFFDIHLTGRGSPHLQGIPKMGIVSG